MIFSKYGLLTEPTLFDFLHEKLITFVPFSIALIALFRYSESLIWLFLYLGIIGAHIIHIVLQKCPHCAYYKADTKRLECLWWRWMPKIWKEQEGPPPKYIRTYTPMAVLTLNVKTMLFLKKSKKLIYLLHKAGSWNYNIRDNITSVVF